MKKTLWTVAATLIAVGMSTLISSCAQDVDNPIVVTDDKPFTYDQFIDESVRPGDDFFRYSLGKWLDNKDLDSPFTTTYSNLQNARDQILLESNDPVVSTVRQLISKSESDCTADMELLKSRIAMLSDITTQDDLLAAFSQLYKLGYMPVVRQICEPHQGIIAPILTSELPSPLLNEYMYYSDLEGLNSMIRHICDRLSIMGINNERIEEIYQHALSVEEMEFNTYDQLFNYYNLRMNLVQDMAHTRGVSSSIKTVCELMGIGDIADKIEYSNVYTKNLIDLLLAGTNESIATMRDYMIFYIMGHDSMFIPQITPGVSSYDRLYYAMNLAMYHMYRLQVEGYGKNNIQKEKCKEMMEEIRHILIERFDNLDWMSSSTKETAKKKALQMQFFIGYPDQWNDEFTPIIEETSLLEAVCSLRRQFAGFAHKLAGRKIQSNCWDYLCMFLPFKQICAYYFNSANIAIILPGYITAPMFDNDQSEAALYASSYAFAHEICHAFDSNGAEYDENGVKRSWWTDNDRTAFEKKQQQMIKLWGQLEHYPGQPEDGEKTLGENMADYGGITLALEAYTRRLKQQGFEGDEFDKQIKKFWLSYAVIMGADSFERDIDMLKWTSMYDVHSAPHSRINGIVRLFDNWYRLYDVKPTDKLYLAPDERVKIW